MRTSNAIVSIGLLFPALFGATAQESGAPGWTQIDPRDFDGEHGAQMDAGLRAPEGFTLDFEALFNDVAREHQLFRQEGLLLLRMDPPGEGGQLSFFVNINGALEPRLRSAPIDAGKWYRVTASWDGTTMWLRLDDRVFRAARGGGPEAVGKPLEIAAAHAGAAGLRGTLRNVRVYDHPMTVAESLLMDAPAAANVEPRPAEPRFDFDSGAQGWRGVRTMARVENGCLVADVSPPNSLLLADNLDYDIDAAPALAIRLAVSGGKWMSCYAVTTSGKREALFPLEPGGKMRNCILWMDQYPEWHGRLKTLALLFDPAAKEVRVDFVHCGAEPMAPPEFETEALYAAPPLPRAGRDFVVRARFKNLGGAAKDVVATLQPPAGINVLDAPAKPLPGMDYGARAEVAWTVRAEKSCSAEIHVAISGSNMDAQTGNGFINVAPARDVTPMDYVPAPNPVATKPLIGAHYCPLWKEGSRGGGWAQIEPFPEREPLLGWYDENNPEVTDWEIAWALDHGIDFFVYCWYRASQGGPVETFIGHAIHEGLFNARYRDRFKFCIMWENQFRGHAGIASEEDLLKNLMPYWIATYFKNPSYLVIDNKPLLFIYRPEFVIDDLGGKEQARQAFDKMRQACRDAGFDGLYLLGEDRGTARAPLELMAALGLDYSFSYCWPVADDPDGPTAIAAQENFWKVRKEMGILPDVLTVSMGWDSTPWSSSFTKWRLTPAEFETACRKAAAFAETLPKETLGNKIVLLDNWNEFGEGHYIAPQRQYGFGYLDAVRNAFATATAMPHEDLTPQDVACGPYNSLYAAKKARDAARARKVFRKGGDAPGLVAWWTFDEEGDEPYAWDYTGHGHGGQLYDIRRSLPPEGTHPEETHHPGRALECNGGAVEVASSPDFAPRKGITVACWIKTDVPDQDDTWFVNRILDGHLDAGFRFGLNRGRLTWAVPQTTWSHHLTADEPLPPGRWTHVAGTCDNRAIRIYMDGRPIAELPRCGTVKDGGTRLVLGNYDLKHRAYFRGLLDDVRIYDHALDPAELSVMAKVGRE